MFFKFIFLCGVFEILNNASAAPLANSVKNDTETGLGYNNYIRYGDMILPKDFFKNPHRNAVPNRSLLWANKRVPYVIDYSLSHATSEIQQAMQEYHSQTCVRFVPRTNERYFLKIFADQGCYSLVGDNHEGRGQPLSLGEGCLPHGTIVHELGHAIGFFHEHQRSDRDNYIVVNWENIEPGMEPQFAKMEHYQNRLINKYDTNSIMHYGETAFSKDGYSKTMEAHNGAALYETYQKAGMTPSDIQRVNILYGC